MLQKLLLLLSLLCPILLRAQTPNGSSGNSSIIIGGTSIDIREAPYQVSIENSTGHTCGGTIISDRWILTAAHCFLGIGTNSPVMIHAGSTDQTNNNIGQRIPSQMVYLHPLWGSAGKEYDIALIYLSQPLQFNHAVMPIEYANGCNTILADVAPGNNAYLTGWGDTVGTNIISTPVAHLRGVHMPLIDRANARAINMGYNSSYSDPITNNMLAFHSIGAAAGSGDSGGPAVINKNGYPIEIGLSSWGRLPKNLLPTIYTNIRNYASWIESITGIVINPSGIDLYTKDQPWDMGFPAFASVAPWTSEDIWVRNQNDGIEEHQNPEYYAQPGHSNYVYVRVRNKGCVPSNGNEQLKLYWAKAATALSWPNHWNGSMSVAGNPLGDLIGMVTLPVIQPGNAYVATFQWQPPNPANFVGLANNPVFWADQPHHFCLLSRIVGASDPMNVVEGINLTTNTLNNNNISWKNLSVVDLNPSNITGGATYSDDRLVGATVLVGDAWQNGGVYDFKFHAPRFATEDPVTDKAEVKITLEEQLWNKWKATHFQAENIEIAHEERRQIRLTADNAVLKGLAFDPNEIGLIHVSFNFLMDETLKQKQFTFEVQQLQAMDQTVVGGETFDIRVPMNRVTFNADAGEDGVIQWGDPITLTALTIGEQAIYNWYNQDKELIYTGQSLTLTPSSTEHYKLEVIAEADGFKDYDVVMVTVNQGTLTNLSPNPASSILNIQYTINRTVADAYIELIGHHSPIPLQYPVATDETATQIEVSKLPTGTYTVVLYCDGVVSDQKNVLID